MAAIMGTKNQVSPEILWQPTALYKSQSNLFKFICYLNQRYQLELTSYDDIYRWSLEHTPDFWQSLWDYQNIIASQPPQQVFMGAEELQKSQWFVGARFNFAENLLRFRDNKTAIIFTNEKNQRRTLSYQQLYEAVSKLAAHFISMGVEAHDRIVGILPNMPETTIAMLATTSLGAIWSSCSPDFGQEALLDRLSQINPKMLVTSDGYYYDNKIFPLEEKIDWLLQRCPSIREVITIDYIGQPMPFTTVSYEKVMASEAKPIKFAQLPFDHPAYIMFSSGTTGAPKCIVHGSGGTLLQHLKELALHTDIKRTDVFFYYTTCGWMMWNWSVSALALGCTLIQYDGAPLWPDGNRLFDLIDQESISIFGTSAKYISTLHKENLSPIKTHKLTSLRQLLSTGSPLVPKSYDYVYQNIKKDICLSSISGGTDIISCFALGNPILPVYKGELQCLGLAMAVQIFDEQGHAVIGEKGDLVCTNAFPSMPIYFWNDPNNEKYHNSYFNHYPNVWAHGDFAEITTRNTLIIYGRSDAVLNPGGVRIGTAEIYRQLERMPKILDAIVVSQEWQDDNRIVLFIVLRNDLNLTTELQDEIKQAIRQHCSPRHVPAKIIAVPEIPRTLSGKLVELAVREVIHNRPVKNLGSIANPDSLDYFRNLSELQT